MTTTEEARNQFAEFIRLHAYDDRYIDREEEKRILEKGIELGIGVNEGLVILGQVASISHIVIERDVEDRTRQALQIFANDGKIDQKEFNNAVLMFKDACKGRVPEPEIRKRIKQIMLHNGWKAKEGGLFGSRWFSDI